jgi:hypothetical protein
VRVISHQSTQGGFSLPVLEGANSVQIALMQVMESLTWGRIEHKTAGRMLYALQTASVNLRNMTLNVADPTDVVIDRDTVRLTCLGGSQWFEEDFEERGRRSGRWRRQWRRRSSRGRRSPRPCAKFRAGCSGSSAKE